MQPWIGILAVDARHEAASPSASHLTGWMGVVARMIRLLGYLTPENALKQGGRPLAHLYWRGE